MTHPPIDPNKELNLRILANARLSRGGEPNDAIERASEALRVLHGLASTPVSAPDALALLHELQVHQVELELQEENLRIALAELEDALYWQKQLYDFAPAGCFTLDPDTVIREVNVAGAETLGCERDAPVGRKLDSFLSAPEADTLRTAMTRTRAGGGREHLLLHFQAEDGTRRTVHGCINVHPAGDRFLIAVLDEYTERK